MGVRNFNRTVFLLLGMLLVVVGMACGSGEPQDRVFELEIQDQALVQGETVLRVNKDDTVTIVVASDEHVSFHLHGYDIEKEAEPGAPATLAFTANATGSFPFTIHSVEEAHEHDAAGESCEVELPPGLPVPGVRLIASPGQEPGTILATVELENFVLDPASESTELAHGHWHLWLNGEIKGMYTSPEVSVVVNDPGEYQAMATLTDSDHCSYGIDAMTTVVVEEGGMGDGMEDDEHEEDEVEAELGRLEVRPR
jgi:hypothetical protein